MDYLVLYGQYQLDRTIGYGGFSKVKLATHVLTGEKVAIKIMQKQALMEDLPRVKHEINALKSLSHTNICKLYQIVETDTHYFLITEYCCGGELLDHIVEKQKLTEDEARLFFQQIVGAISYLHNEGFAHRDLKPENILLDKNFNLKLIDFGLSIKPENGLESHLYTSCGSPNYAAPELIRGDSYLGHEIDIWSLGVLLYALLCGTLPFEDSSIQKLYEKILSGRYEEKWWLSSESKSLLNSLLQVNAKKRISIQKLKTHPWFKKGFRENIVEQTIPKLIKDDHILKLMSQHFNISPKDLWDDIRNEKYDYIMATYLLLLDKKRNNEPLVLLNSFSSPKRKVIRNSVKRRENKKNANEKSTIKRSDTYVIQKDGKGVRASLKHDENQYSGSKKYKRTRSPEIEERSEPESKKIRLHNVKENKTPEPRSESSQTAVTPSTAKKILNGMAKSIRKAKSALTPRRNNNADEKVQPVILCRKNLCNVSSTTSESPDEILIQLKDALNAKGIICTQKGYTLKGKMIHQADDSKKEGNQEGKLSFELEVCWIPSQSTSKKDNSDSLTGAVVGIRRKRLRGDAWIYKNVCEEVLALTAPSKKKC